MRACVGGGAPFSERQRPTWLAKCSVALSALGKCVRNQVPDARRISYSALAYDGEPSPAQSFRKAFSVTLGFIALIHVPLGTALGIYTLWVLLPAESEAEYEKYHAANAA